MKLTDLCFLSFTASYVSAIPTLSQTLVEDERLVTTENMVTSCICSNTTGTFCGERAEVKGNKVISGNCNATSLYFCSQWAAKTGGLADIVQAPCWTGKCHQLKYNKTGIDSCTPAKTETGKSGVRTSGSVPRDQDIVDADPKAETEAAGFQISEAVPRNQDNSKAVRWGKMDPCTCGGLTGHFCGSRHQVPNGFLRGLCYANSLFYCSPLASDTSGRADEVQAPCPNRHCYTSEEPGYDACTPPEIQHPKVREELDDRDEVRLDVQDDAQINDHEHPVPNVREELHQDEAKYVELPRAPAVEFVDEECICHFTGLYCGSRVSAEIYRNDPSSLSGKCKPDALYWCPAESLQYPGPASIFDMYQCTGGSSCEIDEHGDYCLPEYDDRATVPETIHEHPIPPRGLDDEAKHAADCTCTNDLRGYVCGSRDRSTNGHSSTHALVGSCPIDALYYCPNGKGEKALVVQANCAKGSCQLRATTSGFEDHCADS